MDKSIRQIFKVLLIIGVLFAIAVAIGAFFAFGGNNPLLVHMGNVIDMMLVAVTVLFLMAVAYKVYAMATGSRDPIMASTKRKNTAQKNSNANDMPELTELIENLDASEK